MASTTTMAAPTAQTTHLYTCNTCQVAFRGSDLQRSHMQSDWHRYNLKRRVASLPPLTSEIFAEKVLANQATAAATAARAAFEKVCAACERTYFSQNAYQNHIGSSKHRMRVAQLQAKSITTADDDTESMMSSAISLGESVDTLPPRETEDSTESELSKVIGGLRVASPTPGASAHQEARPVSPSGTETSAMETATTNSVVPNATITCLFCNVRSPSIDANVVHMQGKHGMFIPERAYLVDLEGLVEWLSDRVQALHECLYCGLVKHTAHGIQTHMRDKGHCMIAFDSEEEMIELGQFYDFRASYSDDESDDDEEEVDAKKSGGVKLGAKRDVKVDGEDEEDEEWEDEEGEDVDMDDEEEASVADSERTYRGSRRPQVYEEDFELHLPSGRTAGHRTLARYFRQNLHNYPGAIERAQRLLTGAGEDDEPQRGRGGQLTTRANGGLGLAGAPEEAKLRAQKLEKKEVAKAQRAQNRYNLATNKIHNSQKHFRDPLLQ